MTDFPAVKVESYERAIQWRNGLPVVVSNRPITEKGLKELVPAALTLPYTGTPTTVVDEKGNRTEQIILEPEYEGLTNAEVMVIKMAKKAASGNSADTVYLMDRVLGKPRQQNENLNVNASYTEFLDALDGNRREVIDLDTISYDDL